MSFVVDGAEWRFDGWTQEKTRNFFEAILARVATASQRGETIWVGDDLQTRDMVVGVSLWSLKSPDSPFQLREEIWQEIAAWLGRAPRYLDEADWPAGMDKTEIAVGEGDPEENVDIAWAHHSVRSGRAVACIGVQRAGPQKTTSAQGEAIVHWVSEEKANLDFWRAAIDLEENNPKTLKRFAPHAFPDLYICDGVWRGLDRLSGGYIENRPKVKSYLSVFNDSGRWIFTAPPPALRPEENHGGAAQSPPAQLVERRFRGYGLDVAPENPNVYLDPACRRAREVLVGGRTLYCNWHGKLEPHRNRVHVHGPVPESGFKVVIGIVDEHLPLPGD